MRIALKFAYDGKNFSGYARQPNLRTVEGELIKSLIKYGFFEDTKDSMFRSSSRTDKGVSALCNVVAFNTDSSKKQIVESLSDEFEDIVVYGVVDVESDFNPRYAKYRHYRYYLNNNGLDFDKIIKVASYFTGTHNFSNFARLEEFRDPVRTIENIIISQEDGFLIIDFFAQTFLWHQIRRIISSLFRVGQGKLTKQEIVEALANPEKDFDYGLVPANPLILTDINFGFEFDIISSKKEEIEKIKNRIISSIKED